MKFKRLRSTAVAGSMLIGGIGFTSPADAAVESPGGAKADKTVEPKPAEPKPVTPRGDGPGGEEPPGEEPKPVEPPKPDLNEEGSTYGGTGNPPPRKPIEPRPTPREEPKLVTPPKLIEPRPTPKEEPKSVTPPKIEPRPTPEEEPNLVTPSKKNMGTLPVTGTDTAGLAAIGAALLGAGIVAVRRSKRLTTPES